MFDISMPLPDIEFLLFDVFDAERVLVECGHASSNREDAVQIFETVGRFCEDRIQPLDFAMGEQGCSLVDGTVKTPEGMKAFYDDFCADGWMALNGKEEFGGHELPHLYRSVIIELLGTSCLAFQDYIGTFWSTYDMIDLYAPQDLREQYLPGLLAGTIGGTQCMTEPQAGTDLRLTNSTARANDDGTYAISGTKIFISGGSQDLTDDIAHIVLARVPEDGEGNRGLSLFLVPLHLSENGKLERNSVECAGIEHKMGYGAQATCQMVFEESKGWLIGERGRGLSCMFTMVNEARLSTGCQGFAAAEAALQRAVHYAHDRIQGAPPSAKKEERGAKRPIVYHADVRRLLMQSRSFITAARAAYYWLSLQKEIASHHQDEGERERADQLLSILTGTFKAMATDFGFRSCNDSMQVFGGHGYVRETGVEHYVRDCRVAQIYEGANGMLAGDVITRFMLDEDSQYSRTYLEAVQQDIEAAHRAGLGEYAALLANGLEGLEAATRIARERNTSNPDEIGAMAYDHQQIFSLVLLGQMWLKIGVTLSRPDLQQSLSSQFIASKRAGCTYFFEQMFPHWLPHLEKIRSGHIGLISDPFDAVR